MSDHSPEPNDSKKYTLTAFLAFVSVFCLLMLMMNCHGNFVPGGSHGSGHESEEAVHHDANTHAAGDAAGHETTESNNVTNAASLNLSLPGNIDLNANKGGIEDQLITFIKKGYESINEDSLKKIWFDFDQINFNTGSAELTPESKHQVENLTAILKAYPSLKLKIGGYTDKTGDEAVNKKLSSDRANAVKEALTASGVEAQIAGAEGYGSEFAKFAADAPESDRVKDRRIAVRISK